MLTLPLCIGAIYTWLKNQNKKEKVVVVNKKLSIQEWILMFLITILVCVGVYFMLKYFNTENLTLSILSVWTCLVASYLALRRSELNFIFYIANIFIYIGLWTWVIVVNGEIIYLTSVIQVLMNLGLDIFGVVNWLRIKSEQSKDKTFGKIMEVVKCDI